MVSRVHCFVFSVCVFETLMFGSLYLTESLAQMPLTPSTGKIAAFLFRTLIHSSHAPQRARDTLATARAIRHRQPERSPVPTAELPVACAARMKSCIPLCACDWPIFLQIPFLTLYPTKQFSPEEEVEGRRRGRRR